MTRPKIPTTWDADVLDKWKKDLAQAWRNILRQAAEPEETSKEEAAGSSAEGGSQKTRD